MLRFRVIFYAIAAAFLAAPARVLAATPSEKDTPLNLGGGDDKTSDAASHTAGGGSIVRTLIGLAIVVGIIFGLHWILKQAKASKEGKASGAGLAPVATLPIGGGRTCSCCAPARSSCSSAWGSRASRPSAATARTRRASSGCCRRGRRGRRRVQPPPRTAERAPAGRACVDQLRQLTVLR